MHSQFGDQAKDRQGITVVGVLLLAFAGVMLIFQIWLMAILFSLSGLALIAIAFFASRESFSAFRRFIRAPLCRN